MPIGHLSSREMFIKGFWFFFFPLDWVFFFFFVVGVELYKLFVYFGDKALVGCIIYKYFSHFVGGLFVFFSLCKSL